jgi:hypothetical protein
MFLQKLFFLISVLISSVSLFSWGNCIQIEDVYFDSKREIFFVPFEEKVVRTSLWDPFVFDIEKLRCLKKESSRRFDDTRAWEGTTLILCDTCTRFLCHPFHFLEHLLGIWGFKGCEERDNVQHVVLCAKDCCDQDFDWEGERKFSKKILRALFPNARICTLKSLKDRKHSKIFIKKLLFSSRFISFLDPDCRAVNSMLGNCWDSLTLEKIELFRSIILTHYNVFVEPCIGCPRITFFPRHPPRCLSKKIEKHLAHELSDLTGCSIYISDFDKLCFEEQLGVIANTDIFLSTHGRWLCHIPFLPRHAIVIELFPPDCFAWNFWLLARLCRLDYWGNSRNHWVTPTRNPEWNSFGDLDREVDTIDIETTLFIIRDKLQRMSCN